MTARVSGSLTLSCSATGSPTPATAWYKDGHKLAGSDSQHPGDKQGLGEGVAKLVLGCITPEDGGVYECRAQGGGRGQEVAVATSVEVVGHKPLVWRTTSHRFEVRSSDPKSDTRESRSEVQ